MGRNKFWKIFENKVVQNERKKQQEEFDGEKWK